MTNHWNSETVKPNRTLGSLGRRDQLTPERVDRLIDHLRKLASPEGRRGLRVGELRFTQSRIYGSVLAAHQLWQELGLPQMLRRLLRPGLSVPVEAAIFRMVASRLCDPQSKLALSEWQRRVEWPDATDDPDYHHLLRAMDRLLPHRVAIEDQLFFGVTELFSLPLSLVFYDPQPEGDCLPRRWQAEFQSSDAITYTKWKRAPY